MSIEKLQAIGQSDSQTHLLANGKSYTGHMASKDPNTQPQRTPHMDALQPTPVFPSPSH